MTQKQAEKLNSSSIPFTRPGRSTARPDPSATGLPSLRFAFLPGLPEARAPELLLARPRHNSLSPSLAHTHARKLLRPLSEAENGEEEEETGEGTKAEGEAGSPSPGLPTLPLCE